MPGEISVAGINDLRTARHVGLTTVSLPLYEMGSMAARHIIESAPGSTGDGGATTVLSHRLVPRETTARRPAER
ncbi:substrate-binding domain-containing protein [Streptomyces sp. NPDC055243]|uniref:substrate-binding domain-containing protein n=1 Tax=Streptomyces sp. NPDC055243 TaxID=3365720 RepID=UPI0037D3944A